MRPDQQPGLRDG